MIYEMVFFKLWGKNGQDETLLKFQNCFFFSPLNMQLKKASLIKYCFKILTQENKTMLKACRELFCPQNTNTVNFA